MGGGDRGCLGGCRLGDGFSLGVCDGGRNEFPWNVVDTFGGCGNAVCKGLHVRAMLGGALICGLTPDVVLAACWGVAVMP